MKSDKIVSVILYFDGSNFNKKYVELISNYLSSSFEDYEIIVVKSVKSPDEDMNECLIHIPCFRVIYLSKTLDIQTAYLAGLSTAIGDYIVLTDGNISIDGLKKSLNLSVSSNVDLVVGLSKEQRSFLYKIFRRIYFIIFKVIISIDLPKNTSSLRVVSRNLALSLLKKNLLGKQLYIALANTQMSQEALEHDLIRSHKISIYSGFRYSINLMVDSSTRPLRLVSLLGFLGSLLGIIISFFAVITFLVKENNIEGWTSLTLFSSIQFCLVFIILFFIGEYLERSIEQVDNNVNELIVFEKNSEKKYSENRFNIHSEES